MTDRELLELAAKAAGIELQWPLDGQVGAYPANQWWKDADDWNPLEDDGDALRLAVALQIIVGKYDQYANAGVIGSDIDVVIWSHQESDPYAATRRAIVRAAAEIGKGL